jgi:hypothetical protein
MITNKTDNVRKAKKRLLSNFNKKEEILALIYMIFINVIYPFTIKILIEFRAKTKVPKETQCKFLKYDSIWALLLKK